MISESPEDCFVDWKKRRLGVVCELSHKEIEKTEAEVKLVKLTVNTN